jgi:hypothetical protein
MGLLFSEKGRIFNYTLYVRYVHLTKGEAYSLDKPIFSSERMLRKDYDRKHSVIKKSLVVTPLGIWRQEKLIAVNRQS